MREEHRINIKKGEVEESGIAKHALNSGNVLPALTIFKGKRKLKFKPPDDVLATVLKKGVDGCRPYAMLVQGSSAPVY